MFGRKLVNACALVALATTAPLIGTAPPAQAQADNCGTHKVALGDHLSRSSLQYYGTTDRMEAIYAANRDRIGFDPDTLTIGMVLALPCFRADADGVDVAQVSPQTPAAQVQPAAVQSTLIDIAEEPDSGAAETPAMAPKISASVLAQPAGSVMTLAAGGLEDLPRLGQPMTKITSLRLLSGGPFAPFAGDDLKNGGLITEILSGAIALVDDAPEVDIAFVNDRDAHLTILLPRGGFDIGFPWIYPDCALDTLTASEETLCDHYVASDAIFSHIREFYVRADNPRSEAVTAEELGTGVICRPAGYATDDLFQMGLLPDRMTLIRPVSARECLEMLDSGAVDFASMDGTVARAAVKTMEVQNPLLVLDALTAVSSFHAIAPRIAVNAQENIQLVNEGLKRLSENGVWFDIMDAHLEDPEVLGAAPVEVSSTE